MSGIRPALILSNNKGNYYGSIVTVAAITAQTQKYKLPTHVLLPNGKFGIGKTSIVLLEQIRTVSKVRLIEQFGQLDEETMCKVDEAMDISLGRKEIPSKTTSPSLVVV